MGRSGRGIRAQEEDNIASRAALDYDLFGAVTRSNSRSTEGLVDNGAYREGDKNEVQYVDR